MIKWLLIFSFIYLAYGVYLAFDWITCKAKHFGFLELFVTLFCAVGVILIGPGWLFIKVISSEKGE